uniref:Uncharacterized protein n=1 Tax=Arundo donax TaxID=35708 RepID=A0A0A8ZFU4_ARUDO
MQLVMRHNAIQIVYVSHSFFKRINDTVVARTSLKKSCLHSFCWKSFAATLYLQQYI